MDKEREGARSSSGWARWPVGLCCCAVRGGLRIGDVSVEREATAAATAPAETVRLCMVPPRGDDGGMSSMGGTGRLTAAMFPLSALLCCAAAAIPAAAAASDSLAWRTLCRRTNMQEQGGGRAAETSTSIQADEHSAGRPTGSSDARQREATRIAVKSCHWLQCQLPSTAGALRTHRGRQESQEEEGALSRYSGTGNTHMHHIAHASHAGASNCSSDVSHTGEGSCSCTYASMRTSAQ